MVSDVDALYGRLRQAGVVFGGPPEDQSWGARMAALKDPDGNNLYLLQRLQQPRATLLITTEQFMPDGAFEFNGFRRCRGPWQRQELCSGLRLYHGRRYQYRVGDPT